MRPIPRTALAAVLAAAGACAPATQTAGQGDRADRVLMIDANGNPMRQSALGEHTTASFPAPLATVWPAVAAAYAELGIEANYADRPNGRYGARGLTLPRTLKGERIGRYVSCGSSIAGPVVDVARVTADIVTRVVPAADGTTSATFAVSATARRSDGNSTAPLLCASTGRLEEALRAAIQAKVAKQDGGK